MIQPATAAAPDMNSTATGRTSSTRLRGTSSTAAAPSSGRTTSIPSTGNACVEATVPIYRLILVRNHTSRAIAPAAVSSA